MIKDIYFFIQQYLYMHPFLVPLGLIGIWRWSTWLFKEIIARRYRPETGIYKASVSIVTPVYNEDPKIFEQALDSWKKEKPKEIIAIIDYSDKKCIQIFKKFAKKTRGAKLLVTKVPGKRPALAMGIKIAKSEIVALVDSDTLWTKGVIKNGLSPFNNKKTAGVGTYQSVLNPKTLAQRIFDTQLDLRYCDEMPFLAAAGDALVCLSGRTAFYRRRVILPMLDDLVNETFMGEKVISGDDKRLTYLVLEAGWRVAYQNNSHVYTPGMMDLKSYLKQRLRWTRNGIRADLKALRNGWPFKHKALVFFQIDKFAQAVVVILSPIYFLVSILTGLWSAAVLIALWWTVSRCIKMYPHLRRTPRDIFILPVFIIYTFATGVIKIYAACTLNTQGWITRWDKTRLPTLPFIKTAYGYGATVFLLILLVASVFLVKQYTYFWPMEAENKALAKTLPNQANTKESTVPKDVGPTVGIDDLRVNKYIVQNGDSMGSIAGKFGVLPDTLLFANIAFLTNWNRIEPGAVLNIPGKGISLHAGADSFNYQRVYADFLGMVYDETTNTISVTGRGVNINIKDIAQLYPQYLKEVKPKVWYLTANLFIRPGVTLNLNKSEVKWLQLSSLKGKYVYLRANSANVFINGVKITSWDASKNDYDRDLNDGRSYILVKDGARMDIKDSDLGYLGFSRVLDLTTSPYGVSWRMSNGKRGTALLTGDIENSKFHDNYFGAYTFGATGMVWRGNEFHNNIRYGLDPHDDSNGFLVENNRTHNNGSHGIIFSKRCINNVIRNNISYNNKLHGIMLHEKSDHNLIENNSLFGDTDGVSLFHSSSNIVRNNKIENNENGVRADAGSIENLITNNIIDHIREYGVYFYKNADSNSISNNNINNSNKAIYISTNNNQILNNSIQDNHVGIYFLDNATGNKILSNQIKYNNKYGVYSKISDKFKNILGTNEILRNRKDIAAFMK